MAWLCVVNMYISISWDVMWCDQRCCVTTSGKTKAKTLQNALLFVSFVLCSIFMLVACEINLDVEAHIVCFFCVLFLFFFFYVLWRKFVEGNWTSNIVFGQGKRELFCVLFLVCYQWGIRLTHGNIKIEEPRHWE